MTPDQCRVARALLKWSQLDLAENAGVGSSTISRFERGAHTPHKGNLAIIRAALEAAGILFTEGDDTTSPGVQLRDPQKT